MLVSDDVYYNKHHILLKGLMNRFFKLIIKVSTTNTLAEYAEVTSF